MVASFDAEVTRKAPLTGRTAAGAGWLVVSRLFGRGVDFVALLLLARLLTPADFGVTALAMTLVVIADMVLEVPVGQALVRLRQIDAAHLDTAITLGILRSLILAIVLLASAWPFAAFYGDPRLAPLIAVLALGPIVKSLYSPAMVIFARDVSFRQTFVIEMAGKISGFAGAMTILAYGGGYWSIAANYIIATIGVAIASYVVAPYRPRLSFARMRDFSTFIGWFGCAQFVSALNWQLDRILLGRIVDSATLGRYSVASDISVMPTQTLIGPAMQSVMSAFALINDDAVRLRLAFLKVARLAMLLSVPVALGIALTADLIIALLLGPAWSGAAPYLRWLAISVLTIPYFQALYSVSLAIDRPAVTFKLNAIDLLLRTVLLVVGLRLFAVDGAIAARVGVSLVMFLAYLIELRRLIGAGVGEQLTNIWKIVVAGAAMTIAVEALRQLALDRLALAVPVELLLVAVAGAAVYALALLALGMQVSVRRMHLELTDRWL